MNNKVTSFLDQLNHPLRAEIDSLRQIILGSSETLSENIKWNGPNYCVKGKDRITLKIQPPKQIQLIFHRGVAKLEQPENKLMDDKTGLLQWKENDRAVASFKNVSEIETNKQIIVNCIVEWIEATK